MSNAALQRRLAAILAADVVAYSRQMAKDEPGTLARVRALRTEVIEPLAVSHGGRLFAVMGDGFLIEFASTVQAVACALAVQDQLIGQQRGLQLRIGVHAGDVVVDGDGVTGDSVNIAVRLQTLAEPGSICLSDRVREDVAGKLSLDLTDLGTPALKNIDRPIRAFRIGGGEGRPPAPVVPDKPSIAVLPFANLSGDPAQDYFADGVVEEIITALSRIQWLFVIARNSSFAYRGQAADVKRIGRDLGVRYVLEGSIRRSGGRLRITAQLIEAETSTHLWADRFDGTLDDIFDLQDRVASQVAGVIEPALQLAETRRLAARPTASANAYDLHLRALAYFFPISRERIGTALTLFEQAGTIDPGFGLARAWAALCHQRLVADGWADDPEASRQRSITCARHALEVSGSDPGVLVNVASALAYFGEDIQAMIGLVDRALVLNPNFARGWFIGAVIRLWAGQPDAAIEHIEKALRLSPRERPGQPLGTTGTAYFFKREFEEAAARLRLSIQDQPGSPGSYRVLAACYAHMGRREQAQATISSLRAITPLIAPAHLPWRDPIHRELLLEGLRLAAS